ncbi:zf-HC2 domain-containing protein [Paenarthrobacter sp. PH39-S1]|uniref:anti-sigma factor family protein n=1 Tax=Paenarthrobacter sp. PH39-S1 TaxID=3046204 RepID=UPI0024B8A494|nr:zf-HC2 domain-containing protein [Paenarthrobacter sp. PH39-S1]MDJ0355809.1 zf-HC2 domain-containing protein [Paenarthrobacter sp. PH39-S1]
MNTDPADHEALHHLVGAYILGGLDPRERGFFEHHLSLCPLCAGELLSLRSLTGFLDAVPAEAAIAIGSANPAPGPVPVAGVGSEDRVDSEDRAGSEEGDQAGVGPLMAKLAIRHRRARWRSAALVSAVAAACLAIGFVAGPAVNGPPKPEESYTISAASGPQVQLGLLKKAWGTELSLDGHSLPARGVLSLWVKDRAGNYDRAASWSATAQGQAKVTGATPVTIADMSSVEIRDAGGQKIAVLSRVAGD